MTVVKIQGSNLDEVYGTDAFSKPKRRKHIKRTNVSHDPSFERTHQQPTGIDDIFDYYDGSSHDQEISSSPTSPSSPRSRQTPSPRPTHTQIADDVVEHYATHVQKPHKDLLHAAEERENRYIDLGLYLLSGVFLIFILEQFVNIGMALKG